VPISPDTDKGFLDPNDDPFATRGIPVFKPNCEDFNDFEGYMNKIECWGMRSGIVKIIPPREWSVGAPPYYVRKSAQSLTRTNALPSVVPQLAHVRLRNPIEQQMVGRGGLFRQQNIEKRRIMSVREWAELCAKEELRAPTIDEAQGGRRHAAGSMRLRARRGRASDATEEHMNGGGEDGVEEGAEEDKADNQRAEEGASEHNVDNDSDIAMAEFKAEEFDVDPASTLPTPPPTTNLSDPQPPPTDTSTTTTSTKRSAAERKEAREALDAAFLTTFEPHKDWLPHGMVAENYTPEFCRTLERIYWRNSSLGRAPWYGADMKGMPCHCTSVRLLT
jgi:jmjN domain